MSEPIRWNVADLSQIPPVETIRQAVTRERHLLLEFPADAPPLTVDQQIQRAMEQASNPEPTKTEREQAFADAIASLAAALPDCSVFRSGSNWITVMQVVSEQEVLAHADELVSAAMHFRFMATVLMSKLALVFQVPPREINAFFRFRLADEQYSGSLDDDWDYGFHGFECWFGNRRTGQVLEVILSYGEERGILDPYFFLQFLQSTPGYVPLAERFPDFHNMARALDVLAKHGRLRTVPTVDLERLGLDGSGYVAG